MTLIKYIFASVLGALAAIFIGKLVAFTGATTTVDAWILTLTIAGQDVGDRMAMFAQVFFDEHSDALFGMSYLIGHSVLEELVKFIAFFIAFYISKPNSIREIVLNGIAVGIGFATMETFGYYSFTGRNHLFVGFILRAIGHGLFTGIIALLFGMGYFTQMRWIDAGARGGVTAWLVRYEERILQFFWTFVGLICAAILHATVNIYASLGGQAMAIVIMMSIWILFILYLIRPASGRPYGTVIRKVDLLRQIVEAEECLDDLQKQTEPLDASTVPQKPKTRKSSKQFAKG